MELDDPALEVHEDVSVVSAEEARRRNLAARHALETLRGNTDAPRWLDDMWRLIDGGWPWRQAAFIAWASSPKISRQPKTQDELAKQFLGLGSDRVIAVWRKRNPEIDTVIGLLQSAPLWESRADDFRALAEGASRAGEDYKFFNHLKLAMEMRGDYVPKSELEALLKRKAGGTAETRSVEELRRLAEYDNQEHEEDA